MYAPEEQNSAHRKGKKGTSYLFYVYPTLWSGSLTVLFTVFGIYKLSSRLNPFINSLQIEIKIG